ncbi:MAG: EAL domain-containing protein, partial [Acidimicrobiia bacterium]|nr:EAL domain-containing protein [Acidimicrobiia bacterium]
MPAARGHRRPAGGPARPGHQVGETLLADVLLRLGMELPADARVEPVSEDEIAVLVPSVDRLDAAVELGARLGRATSGPYHVGGREVYIATRAGAATSAEVPEPEDLVSAASEALSRAGTGPAGPVVVYREEFSAETFGRISLTGALHRAVERGDLRLVYQPSVELATGRIAGVEALARWDHPELGTISPATFIPIAERTGLIEPIGAWVREEACRQYVAWSERFDVSDLRVSVNVSARESTAARTGRAVRRDPRGHRCARGQRRRGAHRVRARARSRGGDLDPRAVRRARPRCVGRRLRRWLLVAR